jgi:hypothetical protein
MGREVTALTDLNGHYVLTGAPPGSYAIYPEKDGYESNQSPANRPDARHISLSVGVHVTDVDFVIYPAASISGRIKRTVITGDPDPKHVSTSFVERQNLSVRMGNRRSTRLTNAFSRKLENHTAAVALYYFAYNFIKIRSTLRMTPAMAAGVTNRLWEVSDLVALLEASEQESERAA